MTAPPQEPHQPWNKTAAPVTVDDLHHLFNVLEERQKAHMQSLKWFLIFVPLLWGAIAAAVWMYVL